MVPLIPRETLFGNPERAGPSYLVRAGDQLFDGEVVEIRFKKDELAEVVFKQGVSDAAAIKPFREVVKKVTP